MPNTTKSRPVLLYADDHRDAHTFMNRAFINAGVKVAIIPAGDGTEVLQYLSKSREKGEAIYPWPSLLLLELKMPKLSGLAVLQRIKNTPELQGFPIVVFSSSEDAEEMAMAKQLGCSAFVKKRFDMESLIVLAKAIDVEFFGGQETKGNPVFGSLCMPL